MPRNEVLLMLLALALYVYDSACLLQSNQAVFFKTRGRWHAAFGSGRWRLRSREPYIANLLAPHVPLLVMAWSFEQAPAELPSETALDPRNQLPRLRRLTPYILGAAVSMFVLLPVGLFSQVGPAFTLAAIALIYANILIGLFALARMRKSLGLTERRYWQLAAESLLCAPLALNLIRKVDRELRADVASRVDFTAAAQALLRPEERSVALEQCVERLNEQIDFEQEGSPRMAHLVARRAALLDESRVSIAGEVL